MLPYTRSVLAGLGAVASVVVVVVGSPACGSEGSTFGDPNGTEAGLEDGSFNPTGKPDGGDPFANDPPPMYCIVDGGQAPPVVTGTADCPSDKNKPGCGCDTVGEMAACWTGLRANRHNGICKDGVTTCNQLTENTKAWGPCQGEVLPQAGVTRGKDACKCFSIGQWKLKNLSPCFREYCGSADLNPDGSCAIRAGFYAVSTFDADGDGPNPAKCTDQGTTPPGPMPPGPWTTDTLTTDCAGRFTLCYELKAGDFANPQKGDCSLTKQCVTADYIKENVEQAFPPLPAWASPDQACADKWNKTGGYGEMTVVGESVLCDKVDDGAGNAFVFNRVKYCPSKCRDMANAGLPECQNCQQGGSGEFK
jgi:hypothetical protein